MKRGGRQHGTVRTYATLSSPMNPKHYSKQIKQFHSLPTDGMFTKVASKPTNHSSFTGKCGRMGCTGCNLHPGCKSKDKGKGAHKIRSCRVGMNHKLAAWRVVDERGKALCYAGISASDVLGRLVNDYHDDYIDDDDTDNDLEDDLGDGSIGVDLYDQHHVVDLHHDPHVVEEEKEGDLGGFEEENEDHHDDVGDEEDDDVYDDDDDDDSDRMSFCDVGFVIEQVDGDEDWCMVAEL